MVSGAPETATSILGPFPLNLHVITNLERKRIHPRSVQTKGSPKGEANFSAVVRRLVVKSRCG